MSFFPMHHWTEQKITVYPSSCVPALQVAHLMRRHTHVAGLQLSVRALLAGIEGMEETVLLCQAYRAWPHALRVLSDMTATQQRPLDPFDLDRYPCRRPGSGSG